MTPHVRTAAVADVPVLGEVLADAFMDDPLMSWVFPGPERPWRLHAMFSYLAEHRYLPAGASTIVQSVDSASLWLPPSGGFDEDRFWAEHGMPFAAALEGDLDRLVALSGSMGEVHPKEPHWYLLAIGTLSAAQGQGLGSALLAHTLAQADQRGQGAYLEASSPRNRKLYERHGFEVLDECRVEDSPPYWAMWRNPVGTQRSRND